MSVLTKSYRFIGVTSLLCALLISPAFAQKESWNSENERLDSGSFFSEDEAPPVARSLLGTQESSDDCAAVMNGYLLGGEKGKAKDPAEMQRLLQNCNQKADKPVVNNSAPLGVISGSPRYPNAQK